MYILRILIASLAMMAVLFMTNSAHALNVAGVDVPDTVKIGAAGDDLLLNGAGIRKKFIIKVYVGALYLKSKTSDVSKAVSMSGAKRVRMHFLYKKVGADKLNSAWEEGFRANLDKSKYNALEGRLKSFMKFFPDMHKGEEVLLDYIPGTGTEVRINGTLAGTIEGEDFFQALMLVWLGDVPADKGLKKGMLGL